MKYTLPILTLILIASACTKEKNDTPHPIATIGIRFNLKAGAEPFKLHEPYTNSWQEPFTVSAFKFYTGLYELIDDNGNSYITKGESYFLSDAAMAGSLEINTTVTPGRYTQLKFILGVDSARNVSGIQSGVLDPMNGMFWTWNSGYIYAKMEGNSAVSTAVNKMIEYHIGGFRWPYSAINDIVLDLGESVLVEKDQHLNIELDADIQQWFQGEYRLLISETPVCATPGERAYKIARNYKNMFSVSNISLN